jgi:cytochrome c peroxidase
VPVALAWGRDQKLFVALRDARRIAVVDARGWKVINGWEAGMRPSDLAIASDGRTLLVGGRDGEFRVFDTDGRALGGGPTGHGPTRVLPLDGSRAAVASLWDDAVRVVDWKASKLINQHLLPFSPGTMVRRPNGHLLVADAFGSAIADVDPSTPAPARVRSTDGVNLRGMAISGDGKEVLLAHMTQYDSVPITEANIDWGLVLSSRLTAIRLSDFDRDQDAGSALPRRRLILDGSRHGAADPSAIALSPDGKRLLITLAGAHQVLLVDRLLGAPAIGAEDLLPLGHSLRLEVVEVGDSPAAIAIDPSGSFAVTADAMSDTLTVLETAKLTIVARVALGDGRAERTPAQRGEALFLDGRRAMDRWMSCASCHPSGHTNGLNFDTLGDGSYGAAKNTPSLLGVGPTAPFAWTGRFASLRDQVEQSLATSLHGPSADPGMLDDLVAYLGSLPPAPPRHPERNAAVERGAALFRSQRCDSCHRPPYLTIDATRDVGLDDGPDGHRRFNPPALRGVSRSAPYFHDGRARSLRDVLQIHNPGRRDSLTPQQRDDLVAFLESL